MHDKCHSTVPFLSLVVSDRIKKNSTINNTVVGDDLALVIQIKIDVCLCSIYRIS